MGVNRMWKGEQSYECYPPEAVHATFGPAKEFRPGSPRGSVSDRWLSIQCSSDGEGRVEIPICLCGMWLIERVWLHLGTPAGLNLFEKPSPLLWTTWVMCWLKRS